jgi:ABC-type microcin C transport system duplicated ATPase subunit YejF
MNKVIKNVAAFAIGAVIAAAAFAGLETATYIDDLVSTNPLNSDAANQGDDHIRLIKSTLLATFPGVTGAVTPTQTELNYVDGVTSAIQTQLNTGGVNITGKTGTTKTLSTSAASSGADGDIWYRY